MDELQCIDFDEIVIDQHTMEQSLLNSVLDAETVDITSGKRTCLILAPRCVASVSWRNKKRILRLSPPARCIEPGSDGPDSLAPIGK